MSGQRNTGEFHRADPGYRRRMQVFLVIIAVAGTLGLLALHFWLRRMGASLSTGNMIGYETGLHRLLAAVCSLLGVASAGFGYWMFRIAAASKAERRWPPTLMKTSADLRIRYLTSADSLVLQLRIAASVLLALAVILIGWAAWLLFAA